MARSHHHHHVAKAQIPIAPAAPSALHLPRFRPLASCRRRLLARVEASLWPAWRPQPWIKKAVNLHSLRHSFATHLFDRGVDIRTIQALLGHDKLETTARYARVATGMISGVVSPLDELRKLPKSPAQNPGKRPGRRGQGEPSA